MPTATMTSKARVAETLVKNAKDWIDTNTISEVGGPGGTARLRELRAAGWNIKHKQDGSNHLYSLRTVPAKKVLAQFI